MAVVSTVGLEAPQDFPTSAYESVHRRVCAHVKDGSSAWFEYAGAWNGVIYRFLSLAEHDLSFTDSFRRFGDSPSPPERYRQERELFGFFLNGLACVESFAYGLFAIGSLVDPGAFPINKPDDLRSINLNRTQVNFTAVFPEERITATLGQLRGSSELHAWKDIRNILAHRSAPGRSIYTSGEPAVWRAGPVLDLSTTGSRRAWLAQVLSALLGDADAFVQKVFP